MFEGSITGSAEELVVIVPVHRDYRAMVGCWRKEDGLPPLKLPPWRDQRVQKTERRVAQ